MLQNIEFQPQIQQVETTQNNEIQLQQQFLSQPNTQQTFYSQNYPPQNVPQPQYNSNIQQYQLNTNPQQNVKIVQYAQVNFVEQQKLCNSSRLAIMFHCPYCRTDGMTSINYTMGSSSWFMVLLLCVSTWLCCWIPCVKKDCQNVNHFCSNCGKKVGEMRYRWGPEREEAEQET